jgi:hypothetical protein
MLRQFLHARRSLTAVALKQKQSHLRWNHGLRAANDNEAFAYPIGSSDRQYYRSLRTLPQGLLA